MNNTSTTTRKEQSPINRRVHAARRPRTVPASSSTEKRAHVPSRLEREFYRQLDAEGIQYETEVEYGVEGFIPWRFDIQIKGGDGQSLPILIALDGGLESYGCDGKGNVEADGWHQSSSTLHRHSDRRAGDYSARNEMAKRGFTVLQFTTSMVFSPKRQALRTVQATIESVKERLSL